MSLDDYAPGKVPAGWEPFAEEAGRIGSAIVRLPRPGATERDLLIQAGFDPDAWQIKGSINTRRWMRYDQEWLYYYKFDVEAGESPEVVQTHIDDLVAHIRKRSKPAKKVFGGSDAWLYNASDWQIGKREGTDGTEQTIDRVLESIELAKGRIKELRRIGRKMPTGCFFGLGDLGEGTCGFYAKQTFSIDRDRRQQNKITRELITHGIDELRPLFDRFLAGSVAGNHGENRQDGKSVTSDGDNDDVAQFEAVREAFTRAGSDVEWIIPEDELSVMLELGGVNVGFTHGHLFSGGGKLPQAKALEWWKGQDFGFQAIRHSVLLMSAHFHHYSAITHGQRTHFQMPAMDPGSKWVRDWNGNDTPAGVLTMRISDEELLGFADKQVLDAYRRV